MPERIIRPVFGAKDFYSQFLSEHYLYKLTLLRNALANRSLTDESVASRIDAFDAASYRRSLQIEIHFTYFQIVESLFEMIFALEPLIDVDLWYNLSHSNW